MSEPTGAPADFDGRVIPQTNPPTVPRDSEAPPETVTPVGAQFSIDNAPLPDKAMQKAFPEPKEKYKGDGRRLKHGESPTEAIMKRYGIPMTRENYLRANSLDGEVYKPTAEEEQQIPKRFRLPEEEPKVIKNPEMKTTPAQPARATSPDWATLVKGAK